MTIIQNTLATKLAESMVEGMDLETLMVYAVERLTEHYNTLTMDELTNVVKEFQPNLLEE